jgi:hypothetical protein
LPERTFGVAPAPCQPRTWAIALCLGMFEMRDHKAWIIPPRLIEIRGKLAVVKRPGGCGSCDCAFVHVFLIP